MDLREDISSLSPEEQTEWLKAHMPDWERFIEDIRVSREELAAHEASGAPGYPPGWISVEEYRQLRGLPTKPH
jgi:hypothetical protein